MKAKTVLVGASVAVMVFAPAGAALADGGGEVFTAADFVEQAIGLLQGQPEMADLIEDRIGDALEDDEVEGVDLALVAQAQEAFAEGSRARTSGTVLKWDQESLEALEHNIEIGRFLGRFGYWLSPEFGGIPLLHRLYTLHIAILPAIFFLVAAVHLLLVKRHGMAPSPFRKGPVPEPAEPFSRHLARLGGFALILIGIVTVLAVVASPTHGPAPVEGIEVTKPPWPMLWLYPVENWVGVSGILWATLSIFAALLIVPFVDRGQERDPLKRLAVVIPAGIVVLTVLGLIVYALVTPVATHIG